MSKVADLVFDCVNPIAESLGLEVVDVEFGKKVNGNNLTIYIDKVGGVTIDDCEALHKLIDTPLDELDPTNGSPYILNVSSCGLDRPLKTLKDYKRNIGKLVEVKFYKPFNGKKNYEGIICGATESELAIKDSDNNIINIDRELIANVQLVIDF